MTKVFDEEISQHYRNFKYSNHFWLSLERDSVLHYVGDVRGKRILDLGCGDGYICRLLKKKGAELVIGVDISESMIKMAKEEEDKEPLGIDYVVQDVRTMKKIGEFDIVLGNLFLCFMENQKELEMVANVIYENLKIGGRFISFSPDLTRTKLPSRFENFVRFSTTKLHDTPDGHSTLLRIDNLSFEKINIFSFNVVFLQPQIYREVFEKAGFLHSSFEPSLLSEETLQFFPKYYFSDLVDDQFYIIFMANK